MVGVARDVKYHRMNEPPQPFLYMASQQTEGTGHEHYRALAIAGAGGAERGARGGEIAGFESAEPAWEPMISRRCCIFRRSRIAPRRRWPRCSERWDCCFRRWGFTGACLQREPARSGDSIRVALGAQRGHVLGLMWEGIAARDRGRGCGRGGGAAGDARDGSLAVWRDGERSVTFATVAVVVTIVAAIAAYLPARRAMHVDPMVTLRTMKPS